MTAAVETARGDRQSAHRVAVTDAQALAERRWLGVTDREQSQLFAADVAFVAQVRRQGLEAFGASGLPTSRDEDWRYTRLNAFAVIPFVRAESAAVKPVSTLLTTADEGGPRLVFANGRLDVSASRLAGLDAGVRVMGLRAAVKELPGIVEPVLAQIASARTHGLIALNTALFDDGFVVVIERGAQLLRPLHVVYVGGSCDHEARVLRNLIVAGEGSRAAVVEHFVGGATAVSWTSVVTEVAVGAGAEVTHYKVEEEEMSVFHTSSVDARVERDGHFASHLVAAGGQLARTEVRVALAAPGAECTVNGLYLPCGEQHIDCFTLVEHRASHGTSKQLYKGVLDGHSRGVWTGRIIVAEGAAKTNARQTNRNLLLADTAHVDSRPELEIYADDVQCSHGATVGRLDDEGLFYLRARGIDAHTARRILTYAFVNDVLSQMPDVTLRQQLGQALAGGLADSLEVGS